jgi:hypothetical protein
MPVRIVPTSESWSEHGVPARLAEQVRLDKQKALMDAGIQRQTPIQVTTDGVIWDGHHMVRAAAETGCAVTVKVVSQPVKPTAGSIMDLPVG